jgi:integrase
VRNLAAPGRVVHRLSVDTEPGGDPRRRSGCRRSSTHLLTACGPFRGELGEGDRDAALLDAGVDRPRAHPHALRHGHGVHAVLNGVPVNVIQRAFGHALVSTTSIYLAVTGEDVRKAYDKIDW